MPTVTKSETIPHDLCGPMNEARHAQYAVREAIGCIVQASSYPEHFSTKDRWRLQQDENFLKRVAGLRD